MVEGSGLENRRAGNRTVGSNPTSSATAGYEPARLKAQPSSGFVIEPIPQCESKSEIQCAASSFWQSAQATERWVSG